MKENKLLSKEPLAQEIEEFIVNILGINLVSVDGIYYERQEDGQLKNISIDFIPDNKVVN